MAVTTKVHQGATAPIVEEDSGYSGGHRTEVKVSNPLAAQAAGADWAVGQTALSTASGVAVAARTGRRAVTIKNLDAAITIYVGKGTVTSANSMVLKAGESIRIETQAAINALAASGTPSISYVEEYD